MKPIRQRASLRRALGGSIALISVLALAAAWWSGVTIAAPGQSTTSAFARAQNVDYLTADDAQALNVGINVLVPSYVPAPFGGEPQIDASSGYYSLYWMIPGSPPTFLQVTGTAGGALPAGSPADLNNQLSVNASVRGADAIHDVTAIYDNVWWIEGGVLYEVSSLNMTGTDTMGLADSLVSLDIPSGDTGDGATSEQTPPPETSSDNGGDTSGNSGNDARQASVSVAGNVPSGYQATVVVGGASNATLAASDGTFVDTGSATYEGVGSQSIQWQSPDTAQDETVTFTLMDPDSGATLATGQIVVTGTGQPAESNSSQDQAPPTTVATEPPTVAPTEASSQVADTATDAASTNVAPAEETVAPTEVPATTPTPTTTAPPASLRESGSRLLSDGTGGPPPPVYAGDGTGGSYVVTLPVREREDH